MSLVIPNIENITNGTAGLDFQAVRDQTDQDSENAADAATGFVISGMQVTQDTGSDMKIAIASGKYAVNGSDFTYAGTGATPITVAAADTTDRRDIVTIDNTGTVTVTKGTDCGTAGWNRSSTGLPPVKPPIPVNSVLLAEIGVTSSTTVITTAVNVVDKTNIRAPFIGVGTPNSSAQSLTAGSANLVTGAKVALGTGELFVGAQWRFTIAVNKTAAGVATWNALVKFGTAGTTSDGTIATFTSGTNTALADQGVLTIVVTITALGSGTSATASCVAFFAHADSQVTGLGSMPLVPGSTAGFTSTATNPFLHVDITPGASAVMTAVAVAERMN